MNKRVKRFGLKFVGVVLGLWLGWQAAGVAMMQVPGPEQEFARQAATTATMAAAKESAPAGDAGKATGHDGKAGGAEHPESTHLLKPGEGQTPWYGRVVFWAVALFVLAAIIGPLAMKLKTPEPPDPADAHGHDDHAHDDHGHGASHGHETKAHAPAAHAPAHGH